MVLWSSQFFFLDIPQRPFRHMPDFPDAGNISIDEYVLPWHKAGKGVGMQLHTPKCKVSDYEDSIHKL